jgi:hypothetical protein
MLEREDVTDLEMKMLALIPKPAAILSMISSICVIVSVSRSVEKRKKMFHRIALAMSFYGFLQALCYLVGTIAIPKNTPRVLAAYGNEFTCEIQSFFISLATAIPYYYCSLSIYAYQANGTNFREDQIVWLERWIHAIIHALTVPSAIFILVSGSSTPLGPVCSPPPLPIGCEESKTKGCLKHDLGKTLIHACLFGYIPFIICCLLIAVVMVMMYCRQLKIESQVEKLCGKKLVIGYARRKRSRIIALQATLYCLAFFLTYVFGFISRIFLAVTGKPSVKIAIVACTLKTLNSFFFTLVYFGLQTKQNTLVNDLDQQTYCSILRTRLSMNNQTDCLERAEETNTEKPAKDMTFSIFDGTQVATGPWAAFLIDDSSHESVEDIECPDSATEPADSNTFPQTSIMCNKTQVSPDNSSKIQD